MPGPRIAVAGCRLTPSSPPTELVPDEDWPLLRDALVANGAQPHLAAWDDERVDWAAFDAVVIRSTWDVIDRPDEFVDWATAVAGATPLTNPLAAVEWNLDKRYLATLATAGVPTVPTVWVSPGEEWAATGNVVIKPSISAGGRDTVSFTSDQADAAGAHVRRLQASGRSAMVQPHVEGIDELGELKVTFVDGVVTHGVRIGGLLRRGEGVVDRLFEREVRVLELRPAAELLEVANQAMSTAADLIGAPLVYGRVDLVPASGRDPVVLEVEVIEPFLSLSYNPESAARFASAICATVA